jgi:DNA-binding NarL/FixJ family response regulator
LTGEKTDLSYFVLQKKGIFVYKLQISGGLALVMIEHQHHKVLLIDDSQLIGTKVLDLLSTITAVELLGQATSVKEGLRACEEEKPDLVLLDINLPDGSGIALLRELKTRQPHIRVIMLTNSADGFYRRKCAELKAEYFLDKTKDFARIPQLVADCLQLS